ncbi:MAG: hypothetical protein ACRCY3_15020, partial [Sphingorhabdus sp.]
PDGQVHSDRLGEPMVSVMDPGLRRGDESVGIDQAYDIHASIQSVEVDAANAIILIAGSLYLAGEVLKANNQIPD